MLSPMLKKKNPQKKLALHLGHMGSNLKNKLTIINAIAGTT